MTHRPDMEKRSENGAIGTLMKLGLERTAFLVDNIRPLAFKCIHIAGTNGKGSVAHYLSHLLQREGLGPVGRFTSPHLIDPYDCICVDGIPPEDKLFREERARVEAWAKQCRETVTAFEVLTAVAFSVFKRLGVRYAVIECGMGGLRDATNVLSAGEVCATVITAMSIDHEHLLGVTGVEGLTREKCGIFKAGVPVVVDRTNSDMVKQIVSECGTAAGALCVHESIGTSHRCHDHTDGLPGMTSANGHQSPGKEEDEYPSSVFTSSDRASLLANLRGYQRYNFAVAVKASEVATGSSPSLTSMQYASAMGWSGRLQIVTTVTRNGGKTPLLLDGAHNVAGARAFRAFVDSIYRVDPHHSSTCGFQWVIAVSESKDVEGIMKSLIREGDSVIACEFGLVEGMAWVKPAKAQLNHALAVRLGARECRVVSSVSLLMRMIHEGFLHEGEVSTGNPKGKCSIGRDLRAPLEHDIIERPILVSGSLYLIADVLRVLRDDPDATARTVFVMLPSNYSLSPITSSLRRSYSYMQQCSYDCL